VEAYFLLHVGVAPETKQALLVCGQALGAAAGQFFGRWRAAEVVRNRDADAGQVFEFRAGDGQGQGEKRAQDRKLKSGQVEWDVF
jgi:hypothetical protein